MKDHRKERAEARKKAEKLVSQMTILEKASQLKYDAAPVTRVCSVGLDMMRLR